MALSALIKKRDFGQVATQKLATLATVGPRVAKVATFTVANPEKLPIPAADSPDRHRLWRVQVPGCDPLELSTCPSATWAEMRDSHPDATLLEPRVEPVAPAGPLATEDEQAIRHFLASIGEDDVQIIAEVIGHCREDADYRDYYLGRARIELPAIADDRIHCSTCINLTGELCQAARRGELAQTSRNHRPIDRPRRCYCYSPRPDVADRRTGAERYPGMEWMRAKP